MASVYKSEKGRHWSSLYQCQKCIHRSGFTLGTKRQPLFRLILMSANILSQNVTCFSRVLLFCTRCNQGKSADQQLSQYEYKFKLENNFSSIVLYTNVNARSLKILTTYKLVMTSEFPEAEEIRTSRTAGSNWMLMDQ